jgi:uncharacterized tellurite resistance protein B-like protein
VLLAIPALREMSGGQRKDFLEALLAFVRGDGVVTLEEHALAELVGIHLGLRKPARWRPPAAAMRRATATLLAVVARSEAPDEGAARSHFEVARAQARLDLDFPPPPPRPAAAFHEAVRTLRAALPVEKRKVVEAVAWVVSADGVVSPAETAVLRLLADALDCPLPPLAPAPAPGPGGAA